MSPKKKADIPMKTINFNPVVANVFIAERLLIHNCAVEREKIIEIIVNGADRITTKEFRELKIPKSSMLSFRATAI